MSAIPGLTATPATVAPAAPVAVVAPAAAPDPAIAAQQAFLANVTTLAGMVNWSAHAHVIDLLSQIATNPDARFVDISTVLSAEDLQNNYVPKTHVLAHGDKPLDDEVRTRVGDAIRALNGLVTPGVFPTGDQVHDALGRAEECNGWRSDAVARLGINAAPVATAPTPPPLPPATVAPAPAAPPVTTPAPAAPAARPVVSTTAVPATTTAAAPATSAAAPAAPKKALGDRIPAPVKAAFGYAPADSADTP